MFASEVHAHGFSINPPVRFTSSGVAGGIVDTFGTFGQGMVDGGIVGIFERDTCGCS